MAKNNNLTDFLTDVANAIREKDGSTGTINPQDFSDKIKAIQTGVDTTDATATAADILKDKTAYVAGVKVTGAIETYDGTVEDVGPAMRQIPVTKDETTKTSVITGLNQNKVYTVCAPSATPGELYIYGSLKYENGAWVQPPIGSLFIVSQTVDSIHFATGSGAFSYWNNGAVVEADNELSETDVVNDVVWSSDIAYWKCLIEGTLITLTDGTKKPIEQITYDDDLLVWNFYEGKFDTAKPCWIKIPQVAHEYNLCKFSNGAEIGFVGEGGSKGYHRIYNDEAKCFTHTGVAETPIGTTTFAEDMSMPTLVEQEVVKKEVKYYNIITDKHCNLFANGLLTSCKLSNKYAIENMKYVGEQLITDEEEQAYFERINDIRA